ncbi:hypothetical protein Tco_1490623 [Tanacetum coccineum]
MSITKDQQQALDDALVPREQRRRIGKDMLQIFPNLLGQKFVDPPFEEEILAFIRKLGHTGDINGYALVPGKQKILSNKNEYDIRKNRDGGQSLLQKATSQSTDKLCWPFLSEPQMEGQSLARAESAADFFEPRYYALTQGDEIPKEFQSLYGDIFDPRH